MKKIFMASLLVTALATSCSEDLNEGGDMHTASLKASVTAEQTRVAFDKDGSFYWSAGDKIGVTTTNSVTKFSEMGLKTGGEGKATATFEGTISGKVGTYAVYPYYDSHSMSGSTLTYSFPNAYSLLTVDQVYFPENHDGNSYNPAMWAKVSTDGVYFRHLGGVFMVKIAEMPAVQGQLVFATDQNLCGKYTADLNATNPEVTNTDNSATDVGKTVTITWYKATKGQPGVFYIPVPTGSYDATITLQSYNALAGFNLDNFTGFSTTTSTTTYAKVFAGSFNIKRKYMQALTIAKATLDAGAASEVSSTDEASSALADDTKNDNVAITSEIASSTSIKVPVVKTSSASTAKTLTLAKVAKGATFTVEDANASGSESTSIQNFTVSIPNTTSENAPSAVVNMPNSHVALAGNAGTANFNTVTASTGANTLEVSSGVTIQKLVIAKGSVRIDKGATVNEIALGDGLASATLYYEPGANLPKTNLTNITKVGIIETTAQFENALKYGGEYQLMNDVTVTSTKRANVYEETVVIDLNQKTLNMNYAIESEGGADLTFKNGNIKQYRNSGDKDDGGLLVYTKSKLTVDNVNYTGIAGSNDCLFVVNNAQDATLVVKNSKIKGGWVALFTNASTKPEVATANITLEKSSFDADQTGALINIPATVKMTGCTFSGNHQGALLRGGTYTIDGCTFTLNATLASDHKENKWMQDWGSGNACAFAALTMGNYGNAAYDYPTTVTFQTNKSETKVTGDNAEKYPAIHVCSANDKAVTITGFGNYMTTPTSGCKSPCVEYGTTNIKVDEKEATVNAFATNKTSARKK